MKQPDKLLIGLIMCLVAVLTMCVAGIWGIAFVLRHPDIAQVRACIECPWPGVLTVISFIVMWIGSRLMR